MKIVGNADQRDGILRSVINSSALHRYYMIFTVKEKEILSKQELDAMNVYIPYIQTVFQNERNDMDFYEPSESHSENQCIIFIRYYKKDTPARIL